MKRAKHLKYPKHLNLAKGGAVVQKFADGGAPAVRSGALINGGGGGGVNTAAATGAGQTGLTGTIANLLGTQNQFQGQSAAITPGTNVDQLNAAYQNVQGSLANQGVIANQLMPQVGSAVDNQNFLANQYAAMAQGQGPNPAQMELNQATGANVANQAALMAAQRGAGANVGLIARQAAMQGADTQQQAAGQAATLEAQQQIAAQQNLAGLANNQINQAGTATGAYGSAQQNEQNILQGANTAANNAAVGMQSNINNVNSQTAAANQNNNAGLVGGVAKLASNIPVVGSLFGFAHGGEIKGNPLVGNQTAPADNWQAPQFAPAQGAGSGPVIGATASLPEYKDAYGSGGERKKKASAVAAENAGQGPTAAAMNSDIPYAQPTYSANFARGGVASGPHRSHVANYMAGGGAVKAVVSPKEVYLSPEQVHKVVHEGADPMKIGHRFPGKDKVKGRDSFKNDVIPTTLQEGGAVIPVHITTHKDASERGRRFVRRIMAKHMKKPAGVK